MEPKDFFKKGREVLKNLLKDRPSQEFGKPLKNIKPIFKKKGEIACLMLHGWTSTPFEFKAISRFLIDKNITIYAPVLAGHGTYSDALKIVTYKDWILKAEEDFLKLQKEYQKIFLIGNSIGGNLSFILASRYKNIKGIISIGTPIFFRHHKLYKALLEITSLFKEDVNKRYPRSVDREVIRRKKHYLRFPLKSVKEIFKLMKETRRIIAQVNIPTLIIQSETDHLLNKDNAFQLYKMLKSKENILKFVPDAYHVIIDDHRHFDIFGEIYEFIKKHCN